MKLGDQIEQANMMDSFEQLINANLAIIALREKLDKKQAALKLAARLLNISETHLLPETFVGRIIQDAILA